MRHYGPYLLLAVLIALGVTAHVSGVTEFLSLEGVAAKRQTLLEMAAAHAVLAPLAFVAVYVAVAALALPGAAILSLLGGFLFGRWLGTALVVVSATTGALVVFALARSALGGPLRRRAGPLYEKVAANMRENALGYLLFLRLVPLFPFFLVNLVAALFDLKFRTFFLATLVGIAPASFVFVNFGKEIGRVSSFGELLSPSVLIALTGLGLLALVPVLYRQWSAGKAASSRPYEG